MAAKDIRTKGIHVKLHPSELAELTDFQHAKKLRSPGAAARRLMRLKATAKVDGADEKGTVSR